MLNSIVFLAEAAISKKIEMSQVGWVDIVFLLVILWAFIEGYRAGFVKEFSKFLCRKCLGLVYASCMGKAY